MEIIENQKKYAVVIVGSGACGGMAIKVLADAVVEAGPILEIPERDKKSILD